MLRCEAYGDTVPIVRLGCQLLLPLQLEGLAGMSKKSSTHLELRISLGLHSSYVDTYY